MLHRTWRALLLGWYGLSENPLTAHDNRASHGDFDAWLLGLHFTPISSLRCAKNSYVASNESRPFRVPAVYLTWANSVFLAFLAFGRINNLTYGGSIRLRIPIPPARTIFEQANEARLDSQPVRLRRGAKKSLAKSIYY